MKSLFSKYIWLQLILALLLLFGGALIVVFAVIGKANVLEDALNIIAAVMLFLFGLFAILASFAFESDKIFTNGLLYGSGCIALGVFLCLKKLVLLDDLVWLLAIFFIVVGAIEMIKGIVLLIKKVKPVIGAVLTLVIGAIFVAGGILAIIFNADIRLAFCIIAGVLLFIAGVFTLIFGIKALMAQGKNKESKKDMKGSKQEEQEEAKELDYTENKDVPVEQ